MSGEHTITVHVPDVPYPGDPEKQIAITTWLAHWDHPDDHVLERIEIDDGTVVLAEGQLIEVGPNQFTLMWLWSRMEERDADDSDGFGELRRRGNLRGAGDGSADRGGSDLD